MKKAVSLFLLVVMLFSVMGVSAAKMYSLDGRTIDVADWEIEAYRKVGWYYGRPVKMYALDGRTIAVGENDIEAYEKVGWYWGKPVKMYSLDGRTLTIGENRVELYKKVGWYYGKPVKMHALDGRIITIGENEIGAYKEVGWYYGKPVKMHALDGRIITIGENEIEAYKKVGWYYGDPVIMYALDGRTRRIGSNEIEAYKKVGWYYGEPVVMYALDGRTRRIGKNEVEAYERVGWYYGKPIKLYTEDGKSITIGENHASSYLKDGWYKYPVTRVYAPDYTTAEGAWVKERVIPASELEAYKKVGWYGSYSEALYLYVNREVNILASEGDYESAIYWTQEWEDWLEEPYLSWIEGTGRTIANKWKTEEGCPVVIIDSYMDEDEDGYDVAYVKHINLSGKTVVAYRLEFECKNVFGEKCYYNDEYVIKGEIDDAWNPDYSLSDNIYDAVWVYSHTFYDEIDAYTVENAKFTEIVFSDGTKWTR